MTAQQKSTTKAPKKSPMRRPLVPALAGWGTYPCAFASVLLLGLAALGGEWVVHQLEYLIEYGGQYGSVMAASPHRFYMVPVGVALGAGVVAALCLTGIALRVDLRKSRRLLHMLPTRLHRFIPDRPIRIPMASIGATALLLALYQIVVYVIQENLEGVVLGMGWPGLLVLFAPQHATVIPLHFLIALCGSLILWTLSAYLGRSRDTLRAAQALVRLFVRPAAAEQRRGPMSGHIPNLRLTAGILCLRSPPLAA